MRIISKLPLLLFLLLSLTFGGTYAAWIYSNSVIDIRQPTPISPILGEFVYKLDEILPGDQEASKLDENHVVLIQNILDEASYGLNATAKPIIHEYLGNYGIVYSGQTTSGGNLKHILTHKTSSEKLSFVVVKISDTEYHSFTFADRELYGDSVVLGVTEITVYKSVMIRGENGIWTSPRSYVGVAVVHDPGIVDRSVDVAYWRET